MKVHIQINLGTTKGASREIDAAIEILKRLQVVWKEKERRMK